MKNLKKILLTALAVLFTASCSTVHEFPEEGGVDPTLVEVSLDIAIDMDWDGEIVSSRNFDAYASMLESDYDIRYIVEIYKATANPASDLTERVAKVVRTSDQLVYEGTVHIVERVTVPAAEYVVLAWVDFVNKSGTADLNYKTEKLTDVSIIKPGGTYQGYNATKDAFCGRVGMDLTQFRHMLSAEYAVICPVIRPLAVYRIITTDVDKYVLDNPAPYASIRPATTNLSYRFEFPTGYNVQFGKPDRYEEEVGYLFAVEDEEGGSEALIASDFVLIGTDESYSVGFDIKDAGGKLINSVGDLQVRLRRNMITIIRDEFLTTDNTGGIGIDDRFDGEIIIQL